MIPSGTRLGPYEILSPLGAGGMGEVYRAKDTRVDRPVALKVLPEEFLEGEESKARFAREARALASLSHPNVAVLYSFEEIPGSPSSSSRHLLVMEFLEGTTLRDKLEADPISQRQTVAFALQIARGLSAAHEKGIVHRDLKPENLFVTKDGRLKIIDFGLAKRTEAARPGEETSAPTESKYTEPGVVMGTVGYMSPEQVRGLPVDHRSDIFSFGTILYELLSGKKAFKRETAADTMSAILKEEPPELSESGRNIPPALDRVVKHCLEKDRSDRFQSAKDIAFALSEASGQAVTSGRQVSAPASWRTKALIAAAVAVLLAAAGVFLLRRSNKTTTAAGLAAPATKRIAVLPFENLGAAEDGYFADGMTDEVRSKLSGLSGLAVIASASSGQYRATTKPPEQIAKELGVGFLLVAKVRWQKSAKANRIRVTPELVDVGAGGAPTTRWQEAFDADLSDVFKVQGEIATKVAKSLDVVLSGKDRGDLAARPTSNLAAYDAYMKGMEISKKPGLFFLKSAAAQFDQAVALDPGFALAWARSSMSHTLVFTNTDPSPQQAEAARFAAERALELAPGLPLASVALVNYLSWVARDEARAREVFSHALKSAPDDVDLLGRAPWLENDIEKRIELLRRVEELDPRRVDIYFSLAANLQDLRRIREARAECERGLALAPGNLNVVRLMAMTYLQEGDLAGARGVIAVAPREIGPTDFVAYFGTLNDLDWVLDDTQRDLLLRLTPASFEDDRGNWGIVLAQAASRRGEHAKVSGYAEEARKSLAGKVLQDPGDSQSRIFLGLALAYLGNREEAVGEGERAFSVREISKTGQTGGAYIQHQLVRIHILCGNHEKAIDLLEPLLKEPYFLTPGWLRIDPNFDPLRGNPRFEKLASGK
jgi:non-specific serine/threonine protein kinase